MMYMLFDSTAAMYLRPAMKQAGSRLNVLTNALVTRVTFNKRQATGIEYISDGQTKRAFAAREVPLFCHGLYFMMIDASRNRKQNLKQARHTCESTETAASGI